MSCAVMDRGLKKVGEAIQADNAKEYQQAFNMYKEAMEILMVALKRASRSFSTYAARASPTVCSVTLTLPPHPPHSVPPLFRQMRRTLRRARWWRVACRAI